MNTTTTDIPTSSVTVTTDWLRRYQSVRDHSKYLCEPLTAEDCMLQSMPDASPIRWHLAHTTWFFETFLLARRPGYQPFHPVYNHLFNSYYNTIGTPFPRQKRGLLSRPTVAEVWEYRDAVDRHMIQWLTESDLNDQEQQILQTGLQHEQQHQELMLTDVKHGLAINPMAPIYRNIDRAASNSAKDFGFQLFAEEQIQGIGHEGGAFCFDNELPRHRTLLSPFRIQTDLVTNGQYLEFIDDGGYQRPDHWLSSGWSFIQSENIQAPLYWSDDGGQWHSYTLGGNQPIVNNEPVTHLSYFEADAYARWSGHRLPTEFEWECAVAADQPLLHQQRDARRSIDTLHHPTAVAHDEGVQLRGVYGHGWQWTRSDYAAYPGYQPPAGAIGEYNGKFMSGNYVLRGGSCATPPGHTRMTYRNFFAPTTRWQFTAIRLASDV